MQYVSTRDRQRRVGAAHAIAHGISPEGGLFVPEWLPVCSQAQLEKLQEMDYAGRAAALLGPFLPGFDPAWLQAACQQAYGAQSGFEEGRPAPLSRLDGRTYLLELWHGPTF